MNRALVWHLSSGYKKDKVTKKQGWRRDLLPVFRAIAV
jgi:hypothetical protein